MIPREEVGVIFASIGKALGVGNDSVFFLDCCYGDCYHADNANYAQVVARVKQQNLIEI